MKARLKSNEEIINLLHIDYGFQGICSYLKDGEIHYIENQDFILIDNPTKSIDWEQRRYEIAKEALNAIVIANNLKRLEFADIELDCKKSIEYADELIKQLKNK